MGIAESKISYIPKEENMIGYSGDKSQTNTHNKRKVWVWRSRKQCKYPQQRKSVGIGKQKAMQIPTTSEKCGYRETEVSMHTQEEKYDWV